MIRIAIGSDHAGFDFKKMISDYLISEGFSVTDFGTDTKESCDYPDFAFRVAEETINNNADLGILICGTGIGMSIAANKVRGCRAALCSDPVSARFAREHNDAQVLCLGARVTGPEIAMECVKNFLKAEFLGNRHQKRLDMIKECENGKA